jgi:glutamine synthetase type III
VVVANMIDDGKKLVSVDLVYLENVLNDAVMHTVLKRSIH